MNRNNPQVLSKTNYPARCFSRKEEAQSKQGKNGKSISSIEWRKRVAMEIGAPTRINRLRHALTRRHFSSLRSP